jgi:hypothetical protein
VLRRAFIVAGVAAASLVVFLAVFAVVKALAGSSAGALGGALAMALVAVPLRARVSERVERWLYGHRDPSTAVARFSEQLEHGLAADAAPGVGLHSMHERAAELGGRVELAADPSGGLRSTCDCRARRHRPNHPRPHHRRQRRLPRRDEEPLRLDR